MKPIQLMLPFCYGPSMYYGGYQKPQCLIDYERQQSRKEILKLAPSERFALMMRGPIKEDGA